MKITGVREFDFVWTSLLDSDFAKQVMVMGLWVPQPWEASMSSFLEGRGQGDLESTSFGEKISPRDSEEFGSSQKRTGGGYKNQEQFSPLLSPANALLCARPYAKRECRDGEENLAACQRAYSLARETDRPVVPKLCAPSEFSR